MERLTNKRVNGIKTGYWSTSKKEELVQRLAEYEDTGLTPEQVQQLKERDTEKRVDISSRCEEHTHYKCPTCGNILMTEYKGYRIGRITEFCDKCGQRLERGE
ncbi:hypothetical protein LIR45_01390 [Lachnospiraceae bacterium EP-SM-12S-S03]|nr:hypothetical protein [Lachnospiraceae bacterium EP-SM-12S-S03]